MKTTVKPKKWDSGRWYIEHKLPNNISVTLWRYCDGWSIYIPTDNCVYPKISLGYHKHTSQEVRDNLPKYIEDIKKMKAIAGGE